MLLRCLANGFTRQYCIISKQLLAVILSQYINIKDNYTFAENTAGSLYNKLVHCSNIICHLNKNHLWKAHFLICKEW